MKRSRLAFSGFEELPIIRPCRPSRGTPTCPLSLMFLVTVTELLANLRHPLVRDDRHQYRLVRAELLGDAQPELVRFVWAELCPALTLRRPAVVFATFFLVMIVVKPSDSSRYPYAGEERVRPSVQTGMPCIGSPFPQLAASNSRRLLRPFTLPQRAGVVISRIGALTRLRRLAVLYAVCLEPRVPLVEPLVVDVPLREGLEVDAVLHLLEELLGRA